MVAWLIRARGRIGFGSWSWQNSAEVTDVADIADIAVETGRQNIAEYSGERQIAVDCRRLRQSYNRSLVTKLVEIGRRAGGITGVSRNSTPPLNSSFYKIGL